MFATREGWSTDSLFLNTAILVKPSSFGVGTGTSEHYSSKPHHAFSLSEKKRKREKEVCENKGG